MTASIPRFPGEMGVVVLLAAALVGADQLLQGVAIVWGLDPGVASSRLKVGLGLTSLGPLLVLANVAAAFGLVAKGSAGLVRTWVALQLVAAAGFGMLAGLAAHDAPDVRSQVSLAEVTQFGPQVVQSIVVASAVAVAFLAGAVLMYRGWRANGGVTGRGNRFGATPTPR